MDSEVLPTAKVQDLLDHGSIHSSTGGQFSFRVLGPCCRLYDREELPWPCCRLSWRSKEPSWRRIGKRLVADIAAQKCPSYSVEIIQPGVKPTKTILTLFSSHLDANIQEWWYSKHPRSRESSNIAPKAAWIWENFKFSLDLKWWRYEAFRPKFYSKYQIWRIIVSN